MRSPPPVIDWLAAAVLGGGLFGVAETALTMAVVPHAVSMRAGWLLLDVVALAVAAALPWALLGTLGERIVGRRAAPPADAVVTMLVVAVVSAAVLTAVYDPSWLAKADFPARLERVRHLLTGAGVALVVAASWPLRRGVARLLEARRGPALDRAVFAAALALAAFTLLVVAHRGFHPVHLPAAAATCGAVGLGAAVMAARMGWGPPPRARAAVGVILVAVALWPLVPVASPFARSVLFGHVPVVGAVARELRDLADRDGDGVAPAWLGGADCDDGTRKRAPTLVEIPADGEDRDCRGGDASTPPRLERASPPAGCEPHPGWSVLLVSIDALRADEVTPETMPRLSRFAAASHRYPQAYAPAAHTRPTIASLFAARPLSDLHRDSIFGERVDRGLSIPAIFGEVGMHPAGFNRFRLDRWSQAGFPDYNAYFFDAPPAGTKTALSAASTTNGALSFMANPATKPFFVWIHYADAHAPYVLGQPGEGPREAYRRGLRYVDGQLGRLLGELSRLGLADRTIVAVTADHGEELGERGRAGHGAQLHDDTVRVPLAIRVPGCAPRVVDEPVSVTGLGPTLGAAVGIKIRRRGLTHPELPVVVDSGYGGEHHRAVITEAGKLIVDVRNGGRLLFDLASDPRERRDLYGIDAARTEALEAAYQRWLDRPGAR